VEIYFPPDSGVDAMTVQGYATQPLWPKALEYAHNWSGYECVTVPPGGVTVQFTLPAGKPVEVYLLDESPGLPLEGFFLQKARPPTATPIQDGDKTVVSRAIPLQP
jgi:hypothetical protein